MFNIKKTKDFENSLNNLINNSGITVVEAYYIVENASIRLKMLYNELLYKEELEKQNFNNQQSINLNVPAIEDLGDEEFEILPEDASEEEQLA